MRYELGGIVFDPDAAPDVNGVRWVVSELDGWDSPELRQQLLDPTSVHGRVFGESLYGSRDMTMTGVADVPDEPTLWVARNALANATNLVLAGDWLVVHETPPKKCLVRRAGRVRMRNNPDVLWVEFEVPLVAADPRKYAMDDTVVSIP